MYTFIGFVAIMTVIFCHELGHYLAAKVVQLPISEFNVGFGPVILSREWHGTRWCLRLIPLGGYVVPVPFSSNPKPALYAYLTPEEQEIQAYVSRGGEILFALGGITANLIVGFLALVLMGIMPKTVTLDKNDERWIFLSKDVPVWVFMSNEDTLARATKIDIQITETTGDYDGHLQIGDNLLEINDCLVTTATDVSKILRTISPDDDFTATVERDELPTDLIISSWTDTGESCVNFAGNFSYETDVLIQDDLQTATAIAGANFGEMIIDIPTGMVTEIVKGFRHPVDSAKEQSNISAAGNIGKKLMDDSLSDRLRFFAIANIVLAIFNFIPFPPLDGSRIWIVTAMELFPKRFHKRIITIQMTLAVTTITWFLLTNLYDLYLHIF